MIYYKKQTPRCYSKMKGSTLFAKYRANARQGREILNTRQRVPTTRERTNSGAAELRIKRTDIAIGRRPPHQNGPTRICIRVPSRQDSVCGGTGREATGSRPRRKKKSRRESAPRHSTQDNDSILPLVLKFYPY